METLSVGMYVRTKNGMKIGKIAQIHKAVNHKSWYELKNGLRVYSYEKINEPSYNIIDILEVGDYVNGNKVDFTNNNNKLSYEDKCIGFYDGDGDITLFENGIKSVVTHEQMEQMAYKVEE